MLLRKMFVTSKYWCLFFGILTIKLCSGQDYCVTPDRQEGECIPLVQCSYIYAQISRTLTPRQRAFLLNSKCGYINGQVYVCCGIQENPPLVQGQRQQVTPISATSGGSKLPQPPKCGVTLSDRIVGGTVTGIAEYPWLALLEYTKPRNEKGFHCGGTLINDRYIVTAAHCVTGAGIPPDWRLTGGRLGEWNTTTNPDYVVGLNGNIEWADPYVDVAIENSISHPDYQPRSKNQLNDIALLRLQRKITFSDYIQPICLPTQQNLINSLFAGRSADVAGWGQTEISVASKIKLKATLSVMSPNECKGVYRRQNINLESTQICAGGAKGIDSCRGDSGGPLITEERVNNDNFHFLIGVVSFGPSPCGLEGWPGVYTRVGPYVEWIERNIQP